MKFNKIVGLSISSLIILSNSINVFANASTMVISADSSLKLDISQASIISSNGKGEIVSKLEENDLIYQLSVSEGNKYTTGQYALIVSPTGESEVPVYSVASKDSKELGKIPVNSTIVINGTEGNFARILYNDNVGFIENKNTKTTGLIEKEENEISQTPQDNKTEEVVSTEKIAKITSQTGLNFRKEPSTNSDILGKFSFGSNVTVLETINDWYKVKSQDGQIGYISSEFAVLTNENKQEQQPINATSLEIINFAKQYLGKPYIYGGTNLETGTDCSGFTYAVFKHFGIHLNRVSKDQYLNGTPVEKQNLQAGDLVFFNTGGDTPISHVGIYIGNGQYIHSTDSKNQGVIISSLENVYALKTYYGARRVLN